MENEEKKIIFFPFFFFFYFFEHKDNVRLGLSGYIVEYEEYTRKWKKKKIRTNTRAPYNKKRNDEQQQKNEQIIKQLVIFIVWE